MSKAIHFSTSMFDVSKERKNPINPVYGISLLLWLQQELRGKVAITEPDAEDWGWYSELEWQGSSYLVGASASYEDGDEQTAELEWVFQVDKYRSVTEKLFGKNKMTDADSCLLFFKEIFEKHPEIRGVEVG